MTRNPGDNGSVRFGQLAARLLAGALLLLASACGGGGGGASPGVTTTPVISTGLKGSITDNTAIASVKTGASYPVQLYLPADYASTSDLLPVIYLLDGGTDNGRRFETLARASEELGVRAILVGIGGYVRRDTDFRFPGAANYYAFLTSELLPAIESKYRIDAAKRTLSGHSYGGFFVMAALAMDRPDGRRFANFISQDIGTSDQGAQLMAQEQQLFIKSAGKLPATTVVVSGDSQGNNGAAEVVYQQLLSRNYEGLTLLRIAPTSLGHAEMVEPSFRESLRLIFKR